MIKKSIYKVSELLELGNNTIDDNPGIYKWWCKKDTAINLLNNLVDVPIEECLSQMETRQYINNNESIILYCFYVGKTESSLRKRVLNQHINGIEKESTLRRSLFALLHKSDETIETTKEKINSFLRKNAYVEWIPLNKMIIDLIEKYEINTYLRIMNIDDLVDEGSMYRFDKQVRRQIVESLKDKREECKQLMK